MKEDRNIVFGRWTVLSILVIAFISGFAWGYDFGSPVTVMNPLDQLTGMCSEIDELCEKDFFQLCELYIPEIIEGVGNEYIDTSLEEILCASNSHLGPDTWQEGDLGDMIWQAMEELGTCEK